MSDYTVTASAELMENYFQADVLEPQAAFVALQTDAGASLLFSIGTDKVLYVSKELQAQTHGWTRDDLSSAQAKRDFPNGATCATFAAAQKPAGHGSAEIHLGMVLDDGTNEHLYLSLTNSDSDTGWTTNPPWVACPFNAVDPTGKPIQPPSPFRIADVFVGEATDKEYIVVDILRDPNAADPLVTRYYIDASKNALQWFAHDLAADIEAKTTSTCLGRKDRAYGVDGLYTMGTLDGSLLYTPLFNVFATKPSQPNWSYAVAPAPDRLKLPADVPAEAMAALRKPDSTSDLYVTSRGGLYYFASNNQGDKSIATQLITNDLLHGVRALYASVDAGQVTVWGLNGNDDVFYTSCPQAQVASAGSWSRPITILTGVDAISPYIDRHYSANTFFAHASGTLIKVVKSPTTGMWTKRNITLPPLSTKAAATRISSYTTRIQVTGSDGRAATDVGVSLTASNLVAVYINHLYYRIGPDPIVVQTDALGSITIVEQTHTLAATRFTAKVDAGDLPINPMDAPFQRSAKLDSVDKLQGAVITDKKGATRPFMPQGTSTDDLKAVAQSNQGLGKAYATLAPKPAPTPGAKPVAIIAAPEGLAGAIATDLGDLFSWLESGIEAVVSVVENAAEGVWHFVAKIAGEVYHGLLDCVEKVVAAATWIYNAVKILVEDVIAFLEFLFGWQDILVTHRVLKNVVYQYARKAVAEIATLKNDVPTLIKKIEGAIDEWADIPSFDKTPGGLSAANPPVPGQNSAPAQLGVHHFQNNAANASSSLSPVDAADDIFQDLITLLANEANTITGACDAMKKDVIDDFQTLSITTIIKRILAIIADSVLQTVENVLVALLDVLEKLTEGMVDMLVAPLDIPVLSWLYKEVLTDGDELSFLDLLALVAAIPTTIVYKIAAQAAPFPKDDAFTKGLIGASSFDEIRAQFVVSGSAPMRSLSAAGLPGPVVLDDRNLKIFAFATSFAALLGSIGLSIVAGINNTADPEVDPSTTLAAIAGASNFFYVSPNYSTEVNLPSGTWYDEFNNLFTVVSVAKGLAYIKLCQKKNPLLKAAFPTIESILNFVWNMPVIANIIYNRDYTAKKLMVLELYSLANFSFNLGGVLELPIFLTKDPEWKAAEAGVQIGLMLGYGGTMVVASNIDMWAPLPDS